MKIELEESRRAKQAMADIQSELDSQKAEPYLLKCVFDVVAGALTVVIIFRYLECMLLERPGAQDFGECLMGAFSIYPPLWLGGGLLYGVDCDLDQIVFGVTSP